MSNPTMELLRVILIIGILLAIGALIDGYRAKRSPARACRTNSIDETFCGC